MIMHSPKAILRICKTEHQLELHRELIVARIENEKVLKRIHLLYSLNSCKLEESKVERDMAMQRIWSDDETLNIEHCVLKVVNSSIKE